MMVKLSAGAVLSVGVGTTLLRLSGSLRFRTVAVLLLTTLTGCGVCFVLVVDRFVME